MDIKTKRGQILKELRKSKNLNQSELADILNVSNQAYQKYEYGTAEPNFDNLSKLADFYGVTTDYLLGREIQKPAVITPNDEELERTLLEAYRAMPDDARKDFLNHIREAVLAEQNRGSYTVKTIGELEDEMKAKSAEDQDGGKFA